MACRGWTVVNYPVKFVGEQCSIQGQLLEILALPIQMNQQLSIYRVQISATNWYVRKLLPFLFIEMHSWIGEQGDD